ncbi:MAG: hypothetical protein M3Y84_12455 [Acidobacteriota bacterium]|nr:hypothetical protein [Acidobacteriota bacterium]
MNQAKRFTALALLMCSAQMIFARFDRTEKTKWTDSFLEDKADLVNRGKNPFFVLEPGYYLVLEGAEDGKKTELRITVLGEVKKIDGVETRIVEERETQDGLVIEISRNFFAISKRTNSVYYFGEDSKEYKDGRAVNQKGSWEAGVNGARFGLIMPGTVLLGARYHQEIAPQVAMDRAENVSTSEVVQVPAGTFQGCLKMEETTPLETRSKEYKYYTPGIGLVRDGELRLTRYGYLRD